MPWGNGTSTERVAPLAVLVRVIDDPHSGAGRVGVEKMPSGPVRT